MENYRRSNGRGAESAGGESRAAGGGNRIAQQDPFDSQYKYMSTLYRIGNEEMILITGAPDVLFRLCQQQQTEDGLQPLNQPYWEAKLKSTRGKGCAWLRRRGNRRPAGKAS